MPNVLIKMKDESELSLELDKEEVLYDGVERHGTKLPHGCLAGSCGSCRCIIHKGHELLAPARAIEMNTIEHIVEKYEEKYGVGFLEGKIVRLACRARIKEEGDIIIEPIKEKI